MLQTYERFGSFLRGVTHLAVINCKEKLKRKSHLAKKKAVFHLDSVPGHTSFITMSKISEFKFELI